MTEKEKSILKKAVDSHEGQISPSTMINGYAEGNQGLVERLVSQGYLERVYQFREGLHQATYSIIFYAVTEKGLMQFASVPTRLWFNFKSQITLWIGIVSVVVSVGAFISTLYFSHIQNVRQNEDYILRNRPYLVMTNTEIVNLITGKSADFRAIIKNVGVFPAQIKNSSITCSQGAPTNAIGKTIIGNGEQMIFVFSIVNNLGSDATCKLLFTYSTVGLPSYKPYSTEYDIKFTTMGEVIHENALIQ